MNQQHPQWQDEANCIDETSLMYDEEDVNSVIIAKTRCAHCDVKVQCLQTALITREPFGIWGGKTSRERRKAWGLMTLLEAADAISDDTHDLEDTPSQLALP